ncbi:hypothetical protein, partial [Tuberibacillus calidus]|uniref:hypothetical protein n=1 Tax=Tuberibacillus calidus TaxID=340097 RepID=UPI001B7FA975
AEKPFRIFMGPPTTRTRKAPIFLGFAGVQRHNRIHFFYSLTFQLQNHSCATQTAQTFKELKKRVRKL